MKIQILFLCGVLGGSWMLASAQSSTTPTAPSHPAAHPAKNAAVHAAPQDPGERKFQQNCNRCHNAPEEIPTRISGTLLQHMRVRASLSAQDERDILRYLAP
jgi:cytochrome c2